MVPKSCGRILLNAKLDQCPDELPACLRKHAKDFAEAWINSELRPTVSAKILGCWDRLIAEWVETDDILIYIRRNRGDRGSIIQHDSGRQLVPVDNSTAQWAYALALGGICPTVDQVRQLVREDKIPVAMVLKKPEAAKATYKCLIGDWSLNVFGWKLCHIEPVRFRSKIDITATPIEHFKAHFVKFMSPSNTFLVPKVWSGLGELPEMIELARAADAF